MRGSYINIDSLELIEDPMQSIGNVSTLRPRDVTTKDTQTPESRSERVNKENTARYNRNVSLDVNDIYKSMSSSVSGIYEDMYSEKPLKDIFTYERWKGLGFFLLLVGVLIMIASRFNS